MGPIIRRWVIPGKLKIDFRSVQEGSEPAEVFARQQLPALAAGRQSKLWPYLARFYDKQEELGPEQADACIVAQSLPREVVRELPGLDLARWARDWHDPRLAKQLAHEERLAAQAGFEHTPSFLIGRTGGHHATEPARIWQSEAARLHPVALVRGIARFLRTKLTK
jgi:hypothetical protein